MKYSDGVSSAALLVSIGAATFAYRESEANRLETVRPRMTVEITTGENGEIKTTDKEAMLWVNIAATNVGQSPARDVRAIASLVVTNAPQFAYDQFMASNRCGLMAPASSRSVYGGKAFHVVFGLWTHAKTFDENPRGEYLSNGIYYSNGSDDAYAIGCVTYHMDNRQEPFKEGFVYRIAVECANKGTRCSLLGDYTKQGLPVRATLEAVD